MKKKLLLLMALILSLPAWAQTFEYTYEGQTLKYEVIDSYSKTCRTNKGSYDKPGNDVSGDLIIPAVADGYSVIEIGTYAFCNCSGLTSVTIPDSVTEIGYCAFRNCGDLTSVFIPNSVTEIGEYAFEGCSGLTSVTIPDSVTEIGWYAFKGCSGLTSVTIPDSVNRIKFNPFSGCKSLEGFYGKFASEDNRCLIVDGTLQSFAPAGLTSYEIPNSVTEIGYYAFQGCSGLTSVTIPDSVTEIGDSAFEGCSGLTSVTIPNSVTEIGESAFEGCSGLTSVTIPNSVTEIDWYAFKGCSGLTSVIIPNSVTEIWGSAFSGCSGLTSVTIPDSVTEIGESAFKGCSGLTSITIPNSVTKIGSGAFDGCTNLTEVIFNAENCEAYKSGPDDQYHPWNPIFPSNITKLTIGEKVKTIHYKVFSDCSGLTEVIFNAENCEGASMPIFPSNITKATIGEKVKRIPGYIFSGCSGLTSVSIPNSVTWIGPAAFRGCSGLTSVTIPNSVTEIGESAFKGCSGLTSITIPNSVTKIGSGAFDGCTNLTEVIFNAENCEGASMPIFPSNITKATIGEKVKRIPGYIFSGCSGLTSVSIPNSVTEIGESAFEGCSGLKDLRVPQTVTCNDKSLIEMDFSSTVTTVTIVIRSASFLKIIDETGKVISVREAATINTQCEYEWNGNTIKFSNLHPNQKDQLKLIQLLGLEFYNNTKAISLHISNLGIYADINIVDASFDPGDFEITDYYWEFENGEKIHQKRIDVPYGSGQPYFYIVGDNYTKSGYPAMDFPDPEFTEVDAMATSLSKARLTAKCNLSTGATASIEWRRNDAPDNVKSNVEDCPVVNETLMGELRGLRDDVYYKFRPFYERDGRMYYGEWVGFYTGDANVYFEPEVGTLPAYITDNNAEVEGYAYPGTDDVSERGVEYRNTGKAGNATRAEAEWIRVAASSSTFFKVRLENLEYNTDYEYRAFAVAGDKTYYGDTAQFSTGNDLSGVECVTAGNYGEIKVSLYRNPVVGNPEVIVNAGEETVECYIYSIAGTLMKKCSVIADGTPQTVEADLRPGMYIVTVAGTSGIGSARMIVK